MRRHALCLLVLLVACGEAVERDPLPGEQHFKSLRQINGRNPRNLAQSPGYDAEATGSPKGDRILLTSTRDGDIELYSNVCVAEWTD